MTKLKREAKPSGLKVYLGQIDNHDSSYEAIHLSKVIAEVKALNFKRILSYPLVQLVVERPDGMVFAGKMGLICWMLSGRRVEITDYSGKRYHRITLPWIFKRYVQGLIPRRSDSFFVKKIRRKIQELRDVDRSHVTYNANGSPVYLRTNLWFGARSGGSFSHSAGVLNAISERFANVRLLTTDNLPALDQRIHVETISLDGVKGWHQAELVHARASEALAKNALSLIEGEPAPNFIYQRSSLGNFSGLIMAQTLNCPLVIEYNGSEVWVAENWSSGLAHGALFGEIETLNLQQADIVTVISQPVWDEAVSRGVDPARLLLSPNAVDVSRFNAQISDEGLRENLGLSTRTVGIFIGSFGPWHGVPFLIEAYSNALKLRPDLNNTTLLLVGEGEEYMKSRELARQFGLTSEQIVFIGEMPFRDSAKILASGDFYLSPQLPNSDGSQFFGSPTKIFEYMAMGKPIIASDLGQIGSILSHNETALLYEPGNMDALTSLLISMFEDPEQYSPLGKRASQIALTKHTWDQRISELINHLDMLLDSKN